VPEGSITLEEGVRVYSDDGDHVGEIESLLTDPENNEVTHIVISQGLLFKSRKLVPTSWVHSLSESGVYLLMDTRSLERLPDYEPRR
jgi:uncharacterized protein YrrD